MLARDEILSQTFDALEGLSEEQRENKDDALGLSIGKLVKGLVADLVAMGESGAVLLFPGELEHQMNVIGMAALEAIEQWNEDHPALALDKTPDDQEVYIP